MDHKVKVGKVQFGQWLALHLEVNRESLTFSKKNLAHLQIGRHLENGSPVKPGLQLHIGLWFTTWHKAFNPQVPGHGSIHFWLTQALFIEHSVEITHSGLQIGGLPMKPGTQEQTAWPLISLHWLLGPQGEGLHGFCGSSSEMFSL